MNNDNNFYFYFVLSVLANLCQVFDYSMNISQTSNNELSKKLDTIIQQNKDILKRLSD